MQKLIAVMFLVVGIVGCQTNPKVNENFSEGQWEAKVLIKDRKNSKSYVVKVDAYAVKSKSLRVDVTAAMGTPVATLVLNDDKVQYLLPQQRKYFQGKSSENVLEPILAVPIDPRLFYTLLFENSPEEANWNCDGPQGELTKCTNKDQGLKVSWKARKGRRKKILVSHKQASLQFNVTNFKPSLDGTGDIFKLKAPKSFKKFQIMN